MHNYLNEYIYIYSNLVQNIHIMERKLVHNIIKSMIYILNSKRIIDLATKELINKTQVSPKIIPTSSCRLDGSTKESHFTYSTIVLLLPLTKVRDHHRYQPHNTKIANEGVD